MVPLPPEPVGEESPSDLKDGDGEDGEEVDSGLGRDDVVGKSGFGGNSKTDIFRKRESSATR